MNIIENALIAQGGGPTAVINESLVGAILEMKKYSKITNIYGSIFGIKGIINENFLNLSLESLYNLKKIAKTPSAALFSSRDKPDKKYCEKILNVFQKYNIHYFFYIGGNDSANTLLILKKYAEKKCYNLKVFHIPKTIDNDLVENDHSPGYGSAARFITEVFTSINLEIKSLPGIYIGIIMGRNSGFLTASSALAKVFPEDGPHLIYLPERYFNIENFIYDTKKIYDKFGFCIIAASEGICDKKGIPIVSKLKQNLNKDAHGNIEFFGSELGQMLSNQLKNIFKKVRIRYDTFGYLQRSFIGSISSTDSKEARKAGINAVKYAVNKKYNNGSIVLNRIKEYSIKYDLVNLEKIAGKTKCMPNEFINKEGNNITNKFLKYALPLIGNNLKKIAKFKKIKIN